MIDMNQEIFEASEISFTNRKCRVNTMKANKFLRRTHIGMDDNLLHELSYIKDGYADLYHELDLNETTSVIGKLTKYILDVNIKVHHINILFCHTTNTRNSE